MISISAVSAADESSSDIISADNNNELILDETINEDVSSTNENELTLDETIDADVSSTNDNELSFEETNAPVDKTYEKPTLTAGETGSFTDLNATINGNNNNQIILTQDYTFNGTATDDSPLKNGITINRSLTLDGNGHTIKGKNLYGVFNIEADYVIFKNITFIDCNTNASAINWTGAKGTVMNCDFINCSANTNRSSGGSYAYGGAIYWTGANGTVMNCNFMNCSANSEVIKSTSVSMSYSYGGAIYWSGQNGTIMNSNFVYCSANSKVFEESSQYPGFAYGGAIYWKDTNGSVNGCNFTNNTAEDGGAIYFTKAATVNNSKFEENKIEKNYGENHDFNSPAYGGAIHFASDAKVSNSTFIKNQANGDFSIINGENDDWYFNGGGAIYIRGYGLVTNSIFYQNEAKDGAAIYSTTNALEIKDSEFIANKAKFGGKMGWGMTVYDLTIIFDCRDNYINAIFKENDNISLSNVTYWNGKIVNSDEGYPIKDYLSTPFNIRIIDSEDNILYTGSIALNGTKNITFYPPEVDPEGRQLIFSAIHPEDDYYYKISMNLTISASLSRSHSSVEFITAESEFPYNDCYINFTIENYTRANVIITNEDGDTVFEKNFTEEIDMNDPLLQTETINKLLFVDLPIYEGYYNITINNIPSWKILPSSASKLFKISSVKSAINITPLSDIEYSNPIRIEINGENLTTINVTVYNSTKDIVFSQNITGNTVTLPVLPLGEYNVTVINYGNESVIGSENSTIFNVMPAKNNVIVTAEEVTYGEDTTITITADAEGEYTLNINGTSKTVKVENGIGNITLTLNAGTYCANASFDNPNYETAITNDTFNVLKTTTKITATAVTTTYNVKKGLVITLKDGAGKALSGVQVTVNIGSAKKYTTDANGQVKVAISSLVPKTYTAKISFAGNANYMESSATAKVTVKKATPKITAKAKTFKFEDKTKKYTITLKNNKGKVMKKAKLTLKVNGKTYTAKTNSKGVATFKLKKLTKKGKYNAVITYAGNKYYKKATKKAKITVKAPAKKKTTWKTLSKGSKNKATVKKIQRALKDNGYYLSYKGRYLKIDGIYHGHTERSVKQFQKAKKLKVTGKVDYKTAKKLKIVS